MTDARLQRRRPISRLYWFLRDAFSCVRGGDKIWSVWQIQSSTSTTQKIWVVRIKLGHWRKKRIFDKTSAKSNSADGIQFQQHNAILRFCCSLGPTCIFIFRKFCKCKLRRTWTSSYDQHVPPKIHSLAPNLDVLIPTLITELQKAKKPIHNKAAAKQRTLQKNKRLTNHRTLRDNTIRYHVKRQV